METPRPARARRSSAFDTYIDDVSRRAASAPQKKGKGG
eukprot:gene3367-5442_t